MRLHHPASQPLRVRMLSGRWLPHYNQVFLHTDVFSKQRRQLPANLKILPLI
jgi:hypothetical protein